MILEIAGGKCDETLGLVETVISVMGCKWEGILHEMNTFSKTISDLPAAVLEVKVTEILDEKNKRIQNIWDFFQGQTRTINLLDTGAMKQFVEDEEKAEVKTDTGTEVDEAEDPLNPDAVNEFERVRFQYDGELMMDVILKLDEKGTIYEEDCYSDEMNLSDENEFFWDSNNLDKNTSKDKSFWIVKYLTGFGVEIKLKHKLKENLYCNRVDEEKYKIVIENNVGVDTMEGFDDFWTSLKTSESKESLTLCSPVTLKKEFYSSPEEYSEHLKKVGPCTYDITYDESKDESFLYTAFVA